MTEAYEAMRFLEPDEQTLGAVRDKALEEFGDEYSIELVNHEFTKGMRDSYNETNEGMKIYSTEDLAPNYPVMALPVLENSISNYFRVTELDDLLRNGHLEIRVAAYHEDFNPSEADLEPLINLREDQIRNRDNENPTVEDFYYEVELRKDVLNNQFRRFDPLKIFYAEVPMKMENAEEYVTEFKDALWALNGMQSIENYGHFLEIPRKNMSFEELGDVLRARDVREDNTSINAYLVERSQSGDRKAKFTVGLANGIGLGDFNDDEAPFRVKQPGASTSGKVHEISEELKSLGMPVEKWNV